MYTNLKWFIFRQTAAISAAIKIYYTSYQLRNIYISKLIIDSYNIRFARVSHEKNWIRSRRNGRACRKSRRILGAVEWRLIMNVFLKEEIMSAVQTVTEFVSSQLVLSLFRHFYDFSRRGPHLSRESCLWFSFFSYDILASTTDK